VTYTWPSANGTNLYLKNDGNGALTWSTAGGTTSNSLDFDELVDSMTLDSNLTINRGGFKIGIGAAPCTVFEVQGTSSASYFLTGNTIQVGGYASVAYSRFGTTATTHSNYISGSNDLLISGDLEGRGSLSFAGTASLSNTLWVSPGGYSGNVGIGTSAPGTLLDVAFSDSSASTKGITIRNTDTNGYGGSLYFKINQGSGVAYNAAQILAQSGSGTSGLLTFSVADSSQAIQERMRINESGNVGIGTTAPTTKFQVSGNASVSGNFEITGSIIPSAQASVSATTQVITTVDSTGTVGLFSSIAIGADGLPVISYSGAGIKVLKCGNAACSSGNTVTMVDNSFGVDYTSIAIGADGLPVIAVNDTTNLDLKVVKCGNAACSSGNTVSTIDSTGDKGSYLSMTINSDGLPIISYYDETDDDLEVAKCGNAACSSGNTLTTVASSNSSGQYTSIKLGADGLPIISWHYATGVDLYATHCGNLACSSGNTTTVIFATSDVGTFTSLAILPNGVPFISYHDATNGDLRTAFCDDLACVNSSNNIMDSTGTVGTFTSVAVAPDGEPVIAYYDGTNADLKILKCQGFRDGSTGAHCGVGYYVTTAVDSTGDVGKYTSIIVAPDGLPLISYFDVTNNDLKVIKCALPDCSQTTGGGFNNTGSDVGSIGLFFRNIYAAQYWGKKFQIANFDVAEEYIDTNNNLEPGDIVSLTGKESLGIERATSSSSYPVLGIISTSPAIVLGEWNNPDRGQINII